jgi:hypothetical protein
MFRERSHRDSGTEPLTSSLLVMAVRSVVVGRPHRPWRFWIAAVQQRERGFADRRTFGWILPTEACSAHRESQGFRNHGLIGMRLRILDNALSDKHSPAGIFIKRWACASPAAICSEVRMLSSQLCRAAAIGSGVLGADVGK